MENKEQKIRMRNDAIDTIELAHYSPMPWSNALNAAYEMAGNVMVLTSDVFEETLEYRRKKINIKPTTHE